MADLELPSKNVTFLFTDIEGSTRLIEELGEDGYIQALAAHRDLIRKAFGAHGGVEVDTQGDAFLYAFAAPSEAVAAAAQAQHALGVGRIKVRMGLHTGLVRLTDEGYVGRELHRAARIAAAGHGGQVVLSGVTRALVATDATDLGEHRLKDFPEPVLLYQLGSDKFPPLKTISNTNLPRPASSFVGRQRERDQVVAMLRDDTRLLTLSGPGGSGKTRLAIEAASELVTAFSAGVFWVGLAPLREPALVPETIARTIGARDDLGEHIGQREMLLVLDNFEQVVDAAARLGELLERCVNLKVLVTSRELLRIDGEVEFAVPPLAEREAVELFCARSRLAPTATIARLCRRLDDLPLALELAAARTRVLSPNQILDRLSQRLDLLVGGRDADPRQRTLRATIAWSYDLLNEEERMLFARLAVFRGGWTFEVAQHVASAGIDSLQSLVEKSLVRYSGERFRFLETLREFAQERLVESGEEDELRSRHAAYFVESAERAEQKERAGGSAADLVDALGPDLDNIRHALDFARDHEEPELLLRLFAAVSGVWQIRGHVHEIETWLPIALAAGTAPLPARVAVLAVAAQTAMNHHDFERATLLAAEYRSSAIEAGDETQVLAAMRSSAVIAAMRGDLVSARTQFLAIRARAKEMGDPLLEGSAVINLSGVAIDADDPASGLELATEAAQLFRQAGNTTGVLLATQNCGWCALGLGDFALAAASFREALSMADRLGSVPRIADSGEGLAIALVAQHEEERGAQLLGAAAVLRAALGRLLNDALERMNGQAIADARRALDDAAFAAAWARGEAMTADEIVAFAEAQEPELAT